ncbi:MAG: hypothetical protein MJ252_20615, partial [archaeon]|nr:hypothetical protein [archaeon]
MDNFDKIEKFAGDNFTLDNYIYNSLHGLSFQFSEKSERIKDVNRQIENTERIHKETSEKFIDILLQNYGLFIDVGKYVEKIDQNILTAMQTQKDYSSLIQNLRKDVEEFSMSYSKYINQNNEGMNNLQENENKNIYLFEIPEEGSEFTEKNFNIEEFFNPKEGSRKWFEEKTEELKVLIDEKKFDEAVKLVLQ